jgi:hypothetical protein
MTPTMPANSFFDRVREWESFAEGGGFPHFCNQARDPTRGGFLSQLAEQPGQLFFAVLVYNSCGSELVPWIHAHVEGTVAHQAETALCIFELPGRDAKIEKRAADDLDPKVVENFRRVSKIRLSHGEARTEPRQLLAHMLDRVGILIQGQNVGATFQKRFGVATTATGCINHERTRFWLEQFHDSLRQHWTMINKILHFLRLLLFGNQRIGREPDGPLEQQRVHNISKPIKCLQTDYVRHMLIRGRFLLMRPFPPLQIPNFKTPSAADQGNFPF